MVATSSNRAGPRTCSVLPKASRDGLVFPKVLKPGLVATTLCPVRGSAARAPSNGMATTVAGEAPDTIYPLEVVEQSVALAEHVLLVTHRASKSGKQHWYAFGDDFAAWLEKSIAGVRAIDLRAEVGVRYDCNCILLSRLDGV